MGHSGGHSPDSVNRRDSNTDVDRQQRRWWPIKLSCKGRLTLCTLLFTSAIVSSAFRLYALEEADRVAHPDRFDMRAYGTISEIIASFNLQEECRAAYRPHRDTLLCYTSVP